MAEILKKIDLLNLEYDFKAISAAEYNRRLDELIRKIEEVRK